MSSETTTMEAKQPEIGDCPKCNGLGEYVIDSGAPRPCEDCVGSGRIEPDPPTAVAYSDLGAEALAWKADVKKVTLELQERHDAYLTAKKKAATAKQRWESGVEQLQTLILRGPEPMPLFDKEKPGDDTLPLAESEEWKEEDIDGLDVSDSILGKLHEAMIDSLGDLHKWQTTKQLTDIPGIGRGSADKIEAALIVYWEENPLAAQPLVRENGIEL